MTEITIIKNVLTRLCSNQYSLDDIRVFVHYLSDKCIANLKSSGEIKYILYHEHGDLEQKLEDYSIDLIGPLFARDETGNFFIISKLFSQSLSEPEEGLNVQVNKVLKTYIRKGMIRHYEEKDPIGKIFYRSLRYILEKNKTWEKTKKIKYGSCIFSSGKTNSVANVQDVKSAFAATMYKTASVKLKEVLEILINQQNHTVPVSFLLEVFREHVIINHDIDIETVVQDIQDHSIFDLIAEVVDEIDNLILSKYEITGKLNHPERKGFKKAVFNFLDEIISHGKTENYYYYLSNGLDCSISLEDYHSRYKKQFEYVIKKSREIFSANYNMGGNKIV